MLRKGADLGEYKTSSSKIRIMEKKEDRTKLEVIIHEGKNRQVRKMIEYIDCPVISLKRVSIGRLKLQDLKQGQYRHLTNEELQYLKSL